MRVSLYGDLPDKVHSDRLLDMSLSKYPANVFEAAVVLTKRYRGFNHSNLKTPLDEFAIVAH
jgi:hypothetical protein